MQDPNRPAPTKDSDPREQPRPRFLETVEQKRVPLGRAHTDEEALLAAEIEKLRG